MEAIIIGSGSRGLACAVALGRRGWRADGRPGGGERAQRRRAPAWFLVHPVPGTGLGPNP